MLNNNNPLDGVLILKLDLKGEKEEKIPSKKLNALYKEMLENEGDNINLQRAYRYLKAQMSKCSKCPQREIKVREQKYVLPCDCTLCSECCQNMAEDIIGGKIERPACEKHNVRYPVEQFLGASAKNMVHMSESNKLKGLPKKRKLYYLLIISSP